MIVLSGDVRFMRIFVGVPWKGGVIYDSGVVDNGNLGRFRWLFVRKL